MINFNQSNLEAKMFMICFGVEKRLKELLILKEIIKFKLI